MSKTINQALKDLFLGLGGDASALADNKDISDYIDDLESAIKATAAKELPTPAEANVGKVATVIENEGAYSWGAENVPAELPTPSSDNNGKVATVVSDGEGGYSWSAENVPAELPTPAVGDIGKVVSVVSDGESGAEYALETPASGGAIGKWGVTVQCNNGVDITVTLASGITRDDLCNPATNYDINIGLSAYLFYISADYSVMSGVNLTLNSYIQAQSATSNKSLPVFTGILVSNNAGSTGSQGDLYQVIFILGATAADDRLEVIKLTTT